MQKPHAEYVRDSLNDILMPYKKHQHISTKTSTVCFILDESKKVAKFLTIKKERRVNAFKI